MKRSLLRPLALVAVAALLVAGCGKKGGTSTPEGSAPPMSAHETGAAPTPAGDTTGMSAMQNPHAGMSGMENPHAGMSGMPGGTGAIQAQTGGEPGAAAGLRWSVPSRWNVLPERSMRVATYGIPGGGGAECGVYYFGAGQGGNADANIQRWTGQFESGATSKRSTRQVNGVQVSLVEVTGTYLAPSGPMMQSSGAKTGYQLLGAVITGPQGSVFFKLTGPQKDVKAARADFDALVGSIKKE